MDEDQNDHLKAYGITYWALAQGYTGDWLLNYRGGSFAFPDNQSLQLECRIRGVDFEVVSTASYDNILREIASPSINAEKVNDKRLIAEGDDEIITDALKLVGVDKVGECTLTDAVMKSFAVKQGMCTRTEAAKPSTPTSAPEGESPGRMGATGE